MIQKSEHLTTKNHTQKAESLRIEHPAAWINYTSGGILEVRYKDNLLIGLKESKQIIELAHQLTNKIPCPVLIVSGINTINDSECIKFNSSEEVLQYCTAIAFVTFNLPQVIVGNWFMNIFGKRKPIKLFRNEKDAIVWLKSRPKTEMN